MRARFKTSDDAEEVSFRDYLVRGLGVQFISVETLNYRRSIPFGCEWQNTCDLGANLLLFQALITADVLD